MKRVLQSVLCALTCCVAVPGSPALAAPQVLKEIPASLLGDASRQNVFVLEGDADEASNRLLIAPMQARNEDILLDTSKALPLIKSQYSSALQGVFSVHVLKGRPGVMTVIDPQAEEAVVKQPFVEEGDYIALVTSEEDNAVSTISRTPSAILLRASATERREPWRSSARSQAMTLMDRRSSEALAMRASASVPGESLKRPFSRLGCGSTAGLKWWSRARSAASWNFFDSRVS